MVEFEWDDDRASKHLREHGVSFEQATQAFRDPLGIEWLDEREDHGEERSILLGMAQNQLLFVVHADRSPDPDTLLSD
jgi:uncharacterized DUF497 family protein